MMSHYRESDFFVHHIVDDVCRNDQFTLHTHNDKMEILIFFDGDVNFHIEGNVYPLEPMDIVIVQHNELHRVVHKSDCRYERAVINIKSSFFADNNCSAFQKVFVNRRPGEDNIFKHGTPENRLLLECYERLRKYAFDAKPNNLIVKNALIEFLYILNIKKTHHSKASSLTNVRKIVLYINEHITENLNLEMVASQFFMSKYHLCHIFKQNTGFTINQYITQKRLSLVKELCEQGKTLTIAAQEAGFKSYSSFYRAYVNETGKNPKKK